MTGRPLSGIRVLSLAVNLPGPAAAARMVTLGARVTKVEPPSGDPLAFGARPYYEQLLEGQELVQLDLKTDRDRGAFWERLADTDLLLTSSRPSALARLGLDWPTLHERLPRLAHVAIVGHPGPDAEVAGHDLTYQASVGTLQPPQLPLVLVADLAGAERAVADGLAALLQAARTGEGGFREVALSDVARSLAQPAVHGLTVPDGFLGGALSTYGIYSAAQGSIAVAALEEHFRKLLLEELDVDDDRTALADAFARRTADEWEAWARERGLPLAAIRTPDQHPHTGTED